MNSSETHYIDMNKMALDLYKEANPSRPGDKPVIAIKELSLSGNQLVAENSAYLDVNRFKGYDDSTRPKYVAPVDKPGLAGVAMEPQRIRLFELSYNAGSKEPFGKRSQKKMVQLTPHFALD